MADRRNDTSTALTEIRTVRSRAESAIARIDFNGGESESRHIDAALVDGEYEPGYHEHYRDPDADEMVRLLADFIKATEKFAGKGKRKPGQIRRGGTW